MTDLHRTNINLNTEDVAYFQQTYGYGWTEKIREIVHNWVLDKQLAQDEIAFLRMEQSAMNDIDTLMSQIDEINGKLAADLTSTDIDTIIAYHRRQRERKAAGFKPEKPKVDLEAILGKVTIAKKTPTTNPFTRKL